MNQPLDDFDDDMTVPAAVSRQPQNSRPLDDFDDDFTIPAGHKQPVTAAPQDDFEDDVTIAFAPRPDTNPTVPTHSAKLPSQHHHQTLDSTMPAPAQLRPPPSRGAWEPPQRPTSPPELTPQPSRAGRRITAAVVAVLLLAGVLAALVILTSGEEPEPAELSHTTSPTAVAA